MLTLSMQSVEMGSTLALEQRRQVAKWSDVRVRMAATGHDLRLVKELLWDVVSSYLKPAEKDEVRRAIGWSLTAENETMHAEATALADILGEVQLSTGALMERHKLCSNPQRNMVEAEVRMLMDKLRELASTAPFQGSAVRSRDPDAVIPKSSSNERAVFNYVSSGGTLSLDSRPRTPQTRPASAASPNRPGTASSTASSSTSACDPRLVLQSVQGKLNVWDIDAIKGQLQQALQDEHAALLDDIQYLQSLLEGETDLQAKAEQPAPSIQELKEYGGKLKKALADEEQRVVHEVRVSQMFNAADEEQSRPGRLRGMVHASRTAAPSVSGNGVLPGPSVSGVQELSSLSPRTLPRQRSADTSRAGNPPESSSSGLAAVRTSKATSSLGAVGAAAGTESILDRHPRSPASVLSSGSMSGAGAGTEAGEGGVLGRPSRALPSKPTLGSPAASPKLDLASPVRLKPLGDATSLSSASASPSGAKGLAGVGPGVGAAKSPAVASLPPKPLQALSQRPAPASGEARERVSSGGTRRSPSSLGRPPEATGTANGDDRKSSHQAAATSSSSSQSKSGGSVGQGVGVASGTSASNGSSGRTSQPNGGAAASSRVTSRSINLVEALDAEVDAVLGGVAAILARHSYTQRPSSAGSARAMTPP